MISSERTVADASSLDGWYKSSHSGGDQGECLEVAGGYDVVPVRDSKVAHGPVVVASASSWAAFVTAVSNGSLDA
ncbi:MULTISPECIES: DUF397 domain-containing protein [Streptomyces]|uniref:DUF397 domain-containing protein n=2 Tax=Streptomyces TaxID=1883 RepID=A0ABU2RK67_9ACTN|nr:MULTISPECIES: DUF397 domain-containing protein [unclassified Streptomyces]MBK3591328.1 DUF397 domain-containing protein [Streptomyces sp. MBT51]MDT0428359.1 DUF397 domain-containing protein [Streptomyces sp. DSM 41770]HBF79323.1 DUF397 domain-containing protein [Streptomyces sp.]